MFRSPNYKEAGAQMFSQLMTNLPAPEKERARVSFANTPQYVIVSSMEAMNDEALYTPDKINVPVFAILAKSPFWAADTEQFLHSLAPDLEFQWWEGVGHFVMMEKPQQFNDAVIGFLNKKNLLK
jgi:pimeloyl-ACP methyl ester carboxylesterase